MSGWHISVYQLATGRTSPATFDAEQGERLAVWQAGHDGLDWIDKLVATGAAVDLGGDGYPIRYTARLRDLSGPIRKGPPGARQVWSSGPGDIIDFSKWPGRTTIDQQALAGCSPSEWVVVEAWDES